MCCYISNTIQTSYYCSVLEWFMYMSTEKYLCFAPQSRPLVKITEKGTKCFVIIIPTTLNVKVTVGRQKGAAFSDVDQYPKTQSCLDIVELLSL